MKITDEVRIEEIVFRLTVEDVELTSNGYQDGFVPSMVIVTFAKYEGKPWGQAELLFVDVNFARQAWPCPVPGDVQAWIDAKLKDINGGWSVKP